MNNSLFIQVNEENEDFVGISFMNESKPRIWIPNDLSSKIKEKLRFVINKYEKCNSHKY